MNNQENDFQAAYGEAMFFSHLIEDLLALHLFECSFFHVNGYTGLSKKDIRKMTHARRIEELLIIYKNQERSDKSITRLVTALDHLRKIRNHVTHAFIPQVGADFFTAEGFDQIIAMLNNFTYWQRGWLKALQNAHVAVMKAGIANSLNAVLNREDFPFVAKVSRSKIQEHLESLRKDML